VEAGTHTSLIEARGHYFELAQQQNALATQQNDRGNNMRPSDKLAEGPTEDSRDALESAARGAHDEC